MAVPFYGYSCSLFVESTPEYIKCQVCKNVLRDPQLTECCGRNVCHPCIKETIRSDGPCPLAECRRPHVKVSFNRKCKNDIDERRIYCSSKNSGCQWVNNLEKLERHLIECAFVEVECQYCGVHIQRQHVKDHEAICNQHPIECTACGMMYRQQHHSQHMKVCIFATVKCPLSIVGCTSVIMNKDVPKHFDEYLPNHHALVAKLILDLQIKMKEVKRLILQEYEERATHLRNRIQQLNTAIFAAHEKIAALKQALCRGQEEMRDLQKAYETMSCNYAAQIGVGKKEIQVLREGIERLQFCSKVRLYGPPLPRPHPILSHPQKMPPAAMLPFTFTITDFSKKKKHSVVVHSPPFFTHHGGYKMCLQVFCNGNERGTGKYLAIYAYLVKGEHDRHLHWPFYGSITVKIRNLVTNARHHVRTITFDGQTNAGEGECFSQLKSFGHWNFMPFSALFPGVNFLSESRYISNGCLKIDVSSAQVLR